MISTVWPVIVSILKCGFVDFQLALFNRIPRFYQQNPLKDGGYPDEFSFLRLKHFSLINIKTRLVQQLIRQICLLFYFLSLAQRN